ncbi:metal ABC transporter substrate-binding protein [Anaerobutyricum hallii]|uniref:metal ABC transporter substrate-binding protein n=1 Tax=Anaerobutyricum hallii TaxID=39488 RepID=UPI00266CC242|nr:metal ABC transporter substrate-binding protein [Anaerobutyricum hallii]
MKPLFKKKKKLSASSLLLAGLFLCIVLSVGCSVVKNTSGKNATRKNAESENTIEQNSIEKGNSNKISIVCTTFPQYDWVKNILGEEAEHFNVTLLLDNGVDMHSYQPAVKDIATAGSSDLFIYVGGESDTWVEDALKEAKNKDLKAINLMETLDNFVKEEEVVEGMQEERKSLGHSHEKSSKEKQEQTQKESHENSQEINGQKEAADEEPEYDEHIWLSIRNAEIMVKNIEKAIEQLDSDNAKVYQTNAENYIKKLDTLDKQYANTIQNAKYKAILFGDRFPFRYMADDYDLKYYAAFAGCSAETMAGFETVTFLAKKADELRLPVILTIENSDGRIAEAVKSNTTKKNQKILAMNSLQSVTKEQIADGITYLQVMQENLSVLSEALN